MQEGQEWVTACMLSTQNGIRQHGQIPNTQRAPQMIQERALASDLVLVVMLTWQWGQVMLAGL